jgi:uncharacterized caspase-like protein
MANQTCISIGINQYQFLPAIGYGLSDAVAIKNFFVDAAGWSPSQCLLLTDTSPNIGDRSTYPDRENINRWFKQWSWETLHHGDLLWFFFSGCGISVDGEDYLIPIDGNVEDLANTCISLRQLYRQFQEIGVNALVFLDANRSQHLPLSSGIGEVTAKLAQDYQIPTFLSCQSHEFSHEDAGLGHGLFTTALLEALNYHPDLNLGTIDTYLTSRLAELSEHHWKPLQTPVAIVPTTASVHRPVFSATTQTTISTIAPEATYNPPISSKLGQQEVYAAYIPPTTLSTAISEDNYAPYSPPVPTIGIEPIGTSAIVKKYQPEPDRHRIPHWASVSFILGLVVAAGGMIYAFNLPSPDLKEQPTLKPAVNNVTTPLAVTATITTSAVTTTTANQDISLSQAKSKVKGNDATSRYVAILTARKIPVTTPAAAAEVKQSIEQWSQEIYLISTRLAMQKEWRLAIDTAKMVPPDAKNYTTVRESIASWERKLSSISK